MNKRTKLYGLSTLVLLGSTALVIGLVSRGYGQAPSARYEMTAETARDPKTGLVWQRVISADSFSFAQAGQYCADLNLGGGDDWRVPSMHEMHTIVDEAAANPSIDIQAFPDTPPSGFWSGTPWADTPSLAWHVDFDKGSALYDQATAPYRVRCVR